MKDHHEHSHPHEHPHARGHFDFPSREHARGHERHLHEPFGPGPGGARHHGRGPRHEHGGGAHRFFRAEGLRWFMLALLAEQPSHGYQIIKRIEGELGGAHSPSPGIVYPTLTLLEEMGLAAVAAEGTRKLYSITDEGRRELAEHAGEVAELRARMEHAGERSRRDRSGPLVRAMENLRMVLRMHGERWSPEQVAAATEALDEAARRLERL